MKHECWNPADCDFCTELQKDFIETRLVYSSTLLTDVKRGVVTLTNYYSDGSVEIVESNYLPNFLSFGVGA